MGLADELAYMSATEMAMRIRRRDFSPVEVVDALIARIESRNPSLNAFVFKGFDDARSAAKEAEKALAGGAALGPLHGVPTAIKDLFDFKPGWPFTFGGIRAMKDCVAQWHCPFAERVERAGAIIMGKTNSPTMGLRGTCDNFLFGPTRNPFDVRKNAGGSSGGSAAAVADGLVPFAEGTDAGGSIRIPAAWCNLVGFKASFGRNPVVMRPNAFGGSMPFMGEGPISRASRLAESERKRVNRVVPNVPVTLLRIGDGADEIARRARGTPRIAGRLLRRVRDFANVDGAAAIDRAVADRALIALEVDAAGLDAMDRRYLSTVAVNYGGGPVGIETIAAALSEPRDAIEEIIEPFLIQQGFVQRTPRGRLLTGHAFRHLGLAEPARDPSQFRLFREGEE